MTLQDPLFGGFEEVRGPPPALTAPFPYAGGKSQVAATIWRALGQPRTYIEPFAGSLGVLLGRPDPPGMEIVNDAEGLVANFWRAVKSDPDAVAEAVDWPAIAVDLHARGAVLMAARAELVERLEGDPDYYDPKLAGWWAWGTAYSITKRFPNRGPWIVDGGRLVKGAPGAGISREKPLFDGPSRAPGTRYASANLQPWMRALADRLSATIVHCGDWSQVVTPVMRSLTPVAVFLDPPYGAMDRNMSTYLLDSTTVAADVRQWAIDHGEDEGLRIVVAGYESEEPAMPDTWQVLAWSAVSNTANRHRERLWLSPGCARPGS